MIFDYEIFYGQGISIVSPPGTTHHGAPKKRLPMGTTSLDRQAVNNQIQRMRATYTAEGYHLLDYNCNTFTNELLGVLNGRSIPDDILSQFARSSAFSREQSANLD